MHRLQTNKKSLSNSLLNLCINSSDELTSKAADLFNSWLASRKFEFE